MKNIIFLSMIIINVTVFSQTIEISDPVFKARLLATGRVALDENATNYNNSADTNGNGEIELSEALAITGLNMQTLPSHPNPTYIQSLDGLQYFTNIKKLNVLGNHIQSLNVTALSYLETLQCSNNQLNTINVSGLTNLYDLKCYNNLISAIDTSGLTSLETLWCMDNNISTIDVASLTSLQNLWISGNNLTSLNLTDLSQLTILLCSFNNISQLNINGLTNLTEVYADNNLLSALDVTGLTNLLYLDITSNGITSLNSSDLSSLYALYAANNMLNDLTFNDMPDLTVLNIDNNNFSGYLDCSSTKITELNCSNNTGITSINVNNGNISNSDPDLLFYSFFFENLPSLTSICLDNNQYEINSLLYTDFNVSGSVQLYTGENCEIETFLSIESPFVVNTVIYPNPFTDQVTINIDSIYSLAQVFDSSGRMISTPHVNFSENKMVLDLSEITQNGIYILKLTDYNNKSITQKIIKQ